MAIGIGVGVSASLITSPRPTGGNVPINTVAPFASGTFVPGQTVTCTTGTWTSNAGAISYAYQWKRDGSPIGGATNSTYVLTASDTSAITFLCTVTATNTAGSATADSNNMAGLLPP